ncbi:MAG: hypothetical protein ACI9AT_000827 [Ulvibacter sp.]|jgi:hypothetical protein
MEKILGILIIGFLSVLWAVVSFHTFQMNDYSMFVDWWGIDKYWDKVLLISTFLFTIIIATFFNWKILKKITGDYRYHFFYWLIIMILFTYPFVVNRGWYWFQFGLFLGLPAIGINYLANGLKSQNLKRHKNISFIILTLVFLVGGYGEYQASNSTEFNTTGYEFEINTYTIPTFLDWQVEGEIEIENKNTGDDYEFDFWFGNGPYFQICKDIKSDSIFYLKGFDRNGGHNWTINLMNESIDDIYYPDDIKDIEVIAIHDSDFELKKE